MNVFDYNCYKDFLRKIIEQGRKKIGRGYQGMLADSAGCHRPYLSSVLNGNSHLTPEQAMALADFLDFNTLEEEYFLELVNYARAGTTKLRGHIKKRLDATRIKGFSLIHRFNVEDRDIVTSPDIYYSTWIYAVIHILTSIPKFQKVEDICEKLKLEKKHVLEVLQNLIKLELVEKRNELFIIKNTSVHLGRDSDLNRTNHLNFRALGMEQLLRKDEAIINYTAVHSLAKSDIEKIHRSFLEAIDESREIVKDSKEEELVSISLDFFQL